MLSQLLHPGIPPATRQPCPWAGRDKPGGSEGPTAPADAGQGQPSTCTPSRWGGTWQRAGCGVGEKGGGGSLHQSLRPEQGHRSREYCLKVDARLSSVGSSVGPSVGLGQVSSSPCPWVGPSGEAGVGSARLSEGHPVITLLSCDWGPRHQLAPIGPGHWRGGTRRRAAAWGGDVGWDPNQRALLWSAPRVWPKPCRLTLSKQAQRPRGLAQVALRAGMGLGLLFPGPMLVQCRGRQALAWAPLL